MIRGDCEWWRRGNRSRFDQAMGCTLSIGQSETGNEGKLRAEVRCCSVAEAAICGPAARSYFGCSPALINSA